MTNKYSEFYQLLVKLNLMEEAISSEDDDTAYQIYLNNLYIGDGYKNMLNGMDEASIKLAMDDFTYSDNFGWTIDYAELLSYFGGVLGIPLEEIPM